MLDLYPSLTQKDVILMYQGAMSQTILATMALPLRETEEDYLISKRLFAIIIELGQNINHYSEKREFSIADRREVGCGMLVVQKTDTEYIFTAANKIKTSKIEKMKKHCEHINSLNSKKLRSFYRSQRRATRDDGRYGGNIGFIEMVRRSHNPLETKFTLSTKDSTMAYFSIQVKMSRIDVF
ncbi:SiaB family protein kinase [Bernardetia sp.]|uniref:SiaB family protein kinase n=1 Tax=Bernardetia sp. TaxID=1937974 RepID=UPI0025BCD153|nr:SiaB family protein kinase [Bernardetia sp.]